MAINALLVTRIKGLAEALVGAALDGIEIQRAEDPRATEAAIGSAEIILADPELVAPHLEGAAALVWLQSTYAGVEVLFRDSSRRDYRLTRIKGLFGPQMAEYVLGQILARERHMTAFYALQQEKKWQPEPHRQLIDLTMGILGAGDIGGSVAQAARLFGMTVWGLRTRPGPVAGIDRVMTPDQLDEFLAGADYLVNILPSTPATAGLLAGDRLKACKPGTVLINIGRGDIIDEAALIRAIGQGWLGGAVLDVFGQEPLPAQSPLWSLPGVTITPHVAAISFAADVAAIFAGNLSRYLGGEPLLHQVDWDRGY